VSLKSMQMLKTSLQAIFICYDKITLYSQLIPKTISHSHSYTCDKCL